MKPDPVKVSFARLLRNLGSDKSRRAYTDDWARYVLWLELEGVEVTKAKPRHVEDHIAHLQEKGNKRSTCGRALSVIREVYGILVRDEVIEVNPAREVKNPKFDSTPKTPHLTEEQVSMLLSLPQETWKDRRAHITLCLLFGLGWRRTEVAALRVESFRDGTMTGIMKGKKPLTAGVPPWLIEKLNEWLKYIGIESGPILPRSQDNPSAISGDIVYDIVKGEAARAGLPKGSVTPHGLRRTNITLAGKRGVSLRQRQLAVGHSSQATTERYDHARDAAENAPGSVFADLVRGTGVTKR